MSTINGAGSINDGFSFNNKFFQSGDFTQYAGGAETTIQNGYNYLDYVPVVPVTFMVPNEGIASRTEFVVSNYRSVAQNIIISGAQGAGFTFNGQNAVITSGVTPGITRTIHLVSGVKYIVY